MAIPGAPDDQQPDPDPAPTESENSGSDDRVLSKDGLTTTTGGSTGSTATGDTTSKDGDPSKSATARGENRHGNDDRVVSKDGLTTTTGGSTGSTSTGDTTSKDGDPSSAPARKANRQEDNGRAQTSQSKEAESLQKSSGGSRQNTFGDAEETARNGFQRLGDAAETVREKGQDIRQWQEEQQGKVRQFLQEDADPLGLPTERELSESTNRQIESATNTNPQQEFARFRGSVLTTLGSPEAKSAAATGAGALAVAEPTPFGEAALFGASAAVTAAGGVKTGDANNIPGNPFTDSEIAVSDEVANQGNEVSVPDRPNRGRGELDAGGDPQAGEIDTPTNPTAAQSELGIPTGEQGDLSTFRTNQLIGRRRGRQDRREGTEQFRRDRQGANEEELRDILEGPGEDVVLGEDPNTVSNEESTGPEISRDEYQTPREFPTGESAVIGRNTQSDQVTEPDIGSEDTQSPSVDSTTGYGTGAGTGAVPGFASGSEADVSPGLDSSQTPDTDQPPRTDQPPQTDQPPAFRQPPGFDVFNTPEQGNPNANPPGLGNPTANEVTDRFGNPAETSTDGRIRRPRIDTSDASNRDDEDVGMGVAEPFTVDFVDPLSGDTLQTESDQGSGNQPSLPGLEDLF